MEEYNTAEELVETALLALFIVQEWIVSSDPEISMINPVRHRGETINRKRRKVDLIVYELGGYARRYYRMHVKSFWLLHEKLKQRINHYAYWKSEDKKQKRVGPNGNIDSSIRLSCALRYFAGGDPLDIALVHGISFSSVFQSIWFVVDSVNDCFKLEYPSDHSVQRSIAAGFLAKSEARFNCCVGAIDGILIWIERPTEDDCKEAKCGTKKFFCGRKKKFGLGMQAVCDSKRRFLDVCIGQCASTSDYMAFITSKLYGQLEQPGFLFEGAALFGDNAYVSNAYMVTPFKMAQSGSKDAFNFYQSQLRINIECAFGMLVKRWGILRRAMPRGITIRKTSALVWCLCNLHNYCIDEREGVPVVSAQDALYASLSGGVPVGDPVYEQRLRRRGITIGENDNIPTAIIGHGDHMDDMDRNTLRQNQRETNRNLGVQGNALPQAILLRMIEDQGLVRPTPRTW